MTDSHFTAFDLAQGRGDKPTDVTDTDWDAIALVKEHAANEHGAERLGCPVCKFVSEQRAVAEFNRRVKVGLTPGVIEGED